MRIAIDARMRGAENTRGIGRYIEELVRAMVQVAPQHDYVLIDAKIPWYGIAEQIRMPAILRAAHADVVHVPHWNVPLLYRGGNLVITIHDILLRHEPASAKASTRNVVTRFAKRAGFRMVLDHAIWSARKILVPTHVVADDVAHFYPRSASKIVVTGEGMPMSVAGSLHLASGEFRATSYQLPATPFLLYVGSAYPHKGLGDLLAAWERIAHAHPDLRLVIAGEMDVFMKRHASHVVGDSRITFLGRVTDAELRDLYGHASAFVYPSHIEGFGLPPLEAIAAGCLVACSDIPALREVLGNDGAIFFRAGDANDILRAVTELLRTADERRKSVPDLAARLRERWSWKRTAELTLAAYRAAAS